MLLLPQLVRIGPSVEVHVEALLALQSSVHNANMSTRALECPATLHPEPQCRVTV